MVDFIIVPTILTFAFISLGVTISAIVNRSNINKGVKETTNRMIYKSITVLQIDNPHLFYELAKLVDNKSKQLNNKYVKTFIDNSNGANQKIMLYLPDLNDSIEISVMG